jgi:hypothetical protein
MRRAAAGTTSSEMVKLRNTKKLFLKETVIGFGFLSGLWMHLGFDPSTFVAVYLQKLLIAVEPQYENIIKIVFLYGPIVLTLFSVFMAYRRAGYFGLLAVLLAFLAGLWLNLLSIPLLAGAVLIGFFAARRY